VAICNHGLAPRFIDFIDPQGYTKLDPQKGHGENMVFLVDIHPVMGIQNHGVHLSGWWLSPTPLKKDC